MADNVLNFWLLRAEMKKRLKEETRTFTIPSIYKCEIDVEAVCDAVNESPEDYQI